jgi:thermostable 8-oxoguanine DNA glycosylase
MKFIYEYQIIDKIEKDLKNKNYIQVEIGLRVLRNKLRDLED